QDVPLEYAKPFGGPVVRSLVDRRVELPRRLRDGFGELQGERVELALMGRREGLACEIPPVEQEESRSPRGSPPRHQVTSSTETSTASTSTSSISHNAPATRSWTSPAT